MSAVSIKETPARKQLALFSETGVRLHDSKVRSGMLQVGSRLLAALGHHIVGDALTFVKGPHPRAFHRANVHKHIAGAVAWSDESKALLGIKKLHSTCRHGDYPCAIAAF